jgi:hypothetical protein
MNFEKMTIRMIQLDMMWVKPFVVILIIYYYTAPTYKTPINVRFSIYLVHHTIMVIIGIMKMLNIILFY